MIGSGSDKARYYKELIDAGIISVSEVRPKFNLPRNKPADVDDPEKNTKAVLRIIQGGKQ